jgi:hypothetical protein
VEKTEEKRQEDTHNTTPEGGLPTSAHHEYMAKGKERGVNGVLASESWLALGRCEVFVDEFVMRWRDTMD